MALISKNGIVVEMTAEEQAAHDQLQADYASNAFDRALTNLRKEREPLLLESDAMMLPDHPDHIRAGQAAIEAYRKALRDATNGLVTLADVEAYVFPTKP